MLDTEAMALSVSDADGSTLLSANLETTEGREAVETFFHRLVPRLAERPRLVRSRGGHFMDKPDNVISLINVATLRSLEERWGYSLDKLRFRANIYIDGARPWEEFEWIGRDVRIGGASFRVDRRNGRCGATNVDPWTGRRDRDLPSALRAAFGHKDLGVYLVVERSGVVSLGDRLLTSDERVSAEPVSVPPPQAGPVRHICRGCYYIYDEAVGIPAAGIAPGTPPAALPYGYRCPDCGTDAGKLKLYEREAVAS